jgi:NADPH-dependent glutamate synthase beta subunit-like oxidoreductase
VVCGVLHHLAVCDATANELVETYAQVFGFTIESNPKRLGSKMESDGIQTAFKLRDL